MTRPIARAGNVEHSRFSDMRYQNITLEQPEPGIFLLTLRRLKALNALDSATLDELAHAIARVGADERARVMLVTGAGEKALVAGADISEMRDFTPREARAFSEKGTRVMRALEALPVPVVALVNGYALGGGCELALACDWILASENAAFGQPEVNLGIPPGFGGTQRLPRRVGRALALELLTTGRQMKADEALRAGLANHVYPAAELQQKGLDVARAIASKGPLAVRLAKEAARRGANLDLENACALETSLFALACATSDQKEGMRAFLEKRTPRFEGK
jgi:enoyl-CoA hydratase